MSPAVTLLAAIIGLVGGLVIANFTSESTAERELEARRYDAAQALLGTTAAALAAEREWALNHEGNISLTTDGAAILGRIDEAIAAGATVALLMPELQDEADALVKIILSGYGDLYGAEYPTGSKDVEWDDRRRTFEAASATYAQAVRAYFQIPEPASTPGASS